MTRPSKIAAIYLPRFLIQRRLREDPSLANRPIAIVRPGTAETVVAASRAALFEGVAPGMTVPQAKALYAELVTLPDEPEADAQALEALAEAVLALAPGVELCGAESLYADASSAPLFGQGRQGEEAFVRALLACCREQGWRAQVALAGNKFGAMAFATRHGCSVVVTGPLDTALAPMPLETLPASPPLLASLSAMGLKTLGDLARLPTGPFAARFDEEGALMQRLARGDDPRPLVPFVPAPPLVEKTVLESGAETLEPVLFALKTALDRLTARLAGRGLALARGRVTLQLDPEGQSQIELPLSRPTCSTRLLLDLFRERLRDVTVPSPVLGVAIEALETGPVERFQLRIGERPEIDAALETALARLKAGLGEEALFAASLVDTHRPEAAYAPVPFNPEARPCGKEAPRSAKRKPRAFLAKLLQGKTPDPQTPAPAPPEAPPPTRPTRLFEPPRPIEVERSTSGGLTAVRIGRRRYIASSSSGPERLESEWWRKGFQRDYWRAMLPELGRCWLYRDRMDGRFYLHGCFD